jgi:hypothetical protein
MAKKAKNENKAKATKKAPKQPKLPGVTTDRPVVNAKVEAAAEDFRETRDERMALPRSRPRRRKRSPRP